MASCDSCSEKTSKPIFYQICLGETEAFALEDTTHSQNVLQGLYQQFKDERFCDVTLNFGKKEIKAHKVVLASSSQYFEAMFSSNFVDGTQQRLEINGIGETVGEALIEYAYSGKIQITSDNVIELLAGANFLQGFEVVEKSCADYLKKYSGKKNLFQILEVADQYHQNDLKQSLKEFCIHNFVDCVESDHETFLSLDEDLVKELINSQELIVLKDGIVYLGRKQEEYLLEKVLEYLEHNQNNQPKVAQMLKCIHLPLLKKPALRALKTNQLLKSKDCYTVIEEALRAKKMKTKPDWAKWRPCGEYQLWRGRCLANGGQVNTEVETFDDFQKIAIEEDYITGMEFWIRRWDGRPVIGGIKVHYTNGKAIMHGSDKPTEKEQFTLEPNERIVKVDSQSGWMIDNLAFYTNKDRKLGIFGGAGGGFRHESPPGSHGYLACINGAVVDSQNDLGITKLQFVWRFFRTPDQKPVPDYTDPVDYDYLDDYYDDDDNDDYDGYDEYEDYDDYDDYDDYLDYEDFFDGHFEPYQHEPLAHDWNNDWVDVGDNVDSDAAPSNNLDNEVD